MTSRIVRAVIDDDHPVTVSRRASALAHFRNVIETAWKNPSPAAALDKRHLDYFCGHIDGMPGLKDFVPIQTVARHFSSLHPDLKGDRHRFQSSLSLYLDLLSAEWREVTGDMTFRGASVALTFDRARFDANIGMFSPDEPVLSHQMRREWVPGL